MRIKRKDKNFPEDVRMFFDTCYECWLCGQSGADCGHHILRGNFDEADSACNFAPLHNFKCHLGKSFTEEQTNKFLDKTLWYLYIHRWKFKQKDIDFLKKFKSRYKYKRLLNKKLYGR